MAPSYLVFIIAICSIFIFLSSIACIASKLTASDSYNKATCYGRCGTYVNLHDDIPDEYLALGTYPYHLGLDATTLVFVASSIAMVVSFGIGISSAVVLRRRRSIRLSWHKTQVVLFTLFADASLAFSAFVASFVLHSKSEHFSLSYRSYYGGFGYTGAYDRGVFDLETWTCEVKVLESFRYHSASLGRQCAAEFAGRASIAIVSTFAIIMFVAVWWESKKSGSFISIKYETDQMACDAEDDREVVDVAAKRQHGSDESHPHAK
ncbi:hypothetical protein DE146DRAFT_375831 [Phaeosphaeria sp. MPI-PUGE-AT-0046c]|nr:hypothetical protein DE146DRAFT_375831 [Phaeosphaeria sp. MPI-PUGE-AT-0046c]